MCILHPNGDKIEEKFSTLTPDLDRMRDLMVSPASRKSAWKVPVSIGCLFGVSWRVIFPLKLVNPLFIKQLPGRKTDVKDARWIATVLQKELIRGSYVPEHEIQELRLIERR
jgi:hypothetical protein